MADFIDLPCRDEEGHFLVVVEAPRGSWVKRKYDPRTNSFLFRATFGCDAVAPRRDDLRASVIPHVFRCRVHVHAKADRLPDLGPFPVLRLPEGSALFDLAEKRGNRLDWVQCGLCVDERGAGECIPGPRRGSPADFRKFVEESDNTLVIPTK